MDLNDLLDLSNDEIERLMRHGFFGMGIEWSAHQIRIFEDHLKYIIETLERDRQRSGAEPQQKRQKEGSQ